MSSHEMKSHIGDNTPVTVFYEYEPPQKEIRAPNDVAQPGFPAQITINAVLIGADDIEGDLSLACIDRLEDACWRDMEGRL